VAKKTAAIGFDTVRAIGLALPDVTEGRSWGSPSLKVGGRMFACIPTHRSAEADSLVVRLAFDDRDALLEEAPDTYYVAEHYVNYPCVLIRLSRIRRDALEDVIRASWAFERQQRRRAGKAGTSRRAGQTDRDGWPRKRSSRRE
jgi:hypothetical protein